MASIKLENLPIEVLLNITSYLHASSLLSYALSNKILYTAAAAALTKNVTLATRYKAIVINCNHAASVSAEFPSHFRSPITILHDIQEDPDIAFHIKSLHFMNSEYGAELDPEIVAQFSSCDLDGILARCPWFDADDRLMWREDIQEFNHGTALALLLALLPNLENLALAGLLHTYSYWLDLIVRDITRYYKKSKPATGDTSTTAAAGITRSRESVQPLGRIRNVHVEHLEETGGESLHSILPLTMLPAVRRLTCYMVNGYDMFIAPVHTRGAKANAGASSTLQFVEFDTSSISPDSLWRFCANLKNIRQLTYTHGGPAVGGPLGVDMKEYMKDFMGNARAWSEEHGIKISLADNGELDLLRTED